MPHTRERFKKLVAEGEDEQLFEQLAALLGNQKSAALQAKHNELIVQIARKNNLEKNFRLGVLSDEEMKSELELLHAALLELLDKLPDEVFADDTTTPKTTEIGLPVSVRRGLWWFFAVFNGMVAGGSFLQGDWLAGSTCAAAMLLCVPDFYEWLCRKMGFRLSTAVRVLLVLGLVAVGLSFDSNLQKRRAEGRNLTK